MKRPVALALLALGLPVAVAAQEIDTLALRAHTYFLSHDLLEGRGTGTRGARLAATYLVSQLMGLGLQPIGPAGSYTLPVPLKAARIDTSSQIAVRLGDGVDTFHNGRDFIVQTGGAGAFHDFGGEALFVGSPAQAAASLARTGSLRGKVLLVTGTLGATAQTLVPDWIRRGAEGIIILVGDDATYDLFVRSRGESRFYVDAPVNDPVWQPSIPMIIAGPTLTRALILAGPLPDSVLAGKPPAAAIPLDRTLQAHIGATVSDVPAMNVAGMIPGKDPARRNEFVVYTAHYDHLGISTPDARGDSIYNGFSDNAAGDAMLLAIAERMQRDPPDRSVLFLFFTGEERGLLGSTYYAARPAIPLSRVVAVINLDAGAPPAPPLSWRIAGGEDSALGALAQKVAEAHGWEAMRTGASPNSDYWPFLHRGIPSIFLVPGPHWQGIQGAAQEALRQRWEHYHQAADEWSPDFPFSGLERYAQYALEVGREVADAGPAPAAGAENR